MERMSSLWCSIGFPCVELVALRLAQVEFNLACIRMLCNSRRDVGLLSWRVRIHSITNVSSCVGSLECCAVALDALLAEERVRPVRAIDICTICDRRLRKGASRDSWRAVLASRRLALTRGITASAEYEDRCLYSRCLPEAAQYRLRIWPGKDQELVQHSASKTDPAPSGTFATDGCNEIRIASVVGGESETEE